MYCQQCGNVLKQGAAFCPNCGFKLNSTVTTTNTQTDFEGTVGVFEASPSTQSAEHIVETSIEVKTVVQAPVQQPAQPTYQTPIQQQNVHTPATGEANNGRVNFGEAVTLFFKNYVNFKGRASKSEYWWILLFGIITYIPLYLISIIVPPIGGFCSIALMIPNISLTVRRLHDIGKPGTYYFISFIPIVGGIFLLIQLLKDSDGDNQWGPGAATVGGSSQFANTFVNNIAPARRVVTDNDICTIAQKHEPINLYDPNAKKMMDAALSRIVYTYTGAEDLARAIMLCDPQTINANIAAIDTDSLIVIFKALGFYIGQGSDINVLGMVQRNVLATLKTRF